jgi:hypothetical protein
METNCNKYIQEYILCMKKEPSKFPCDDKCKIPFYLVLKCLEKNN